MLLPLQQGGTPSHPTWGKEPTLGLPLQMLHPQTDQLQLCVLPTATAWTCSCPTHLHVCQIPMQVLIMLCDFSCEEVDRHLLTPGRVGLKTDQRNLSTQVWLGEFNRAAHTCMGGGLPAGAWVTPKELGRCKVPPKMVAAHHSFVTAGLRPGAGRPSH